MITLLRSHWLLFLGALFFGIAYTQSPLYFSNQHQYFVHGLAWSGYGNLEEDWLANTVDSTPLYSGMICWINRYLDGRLVYVLYLAMLAIYFISLIAILAAFLPHDPRRTNILIGCGSLVILIHSAFVRWLSVEILGIDYPWFLQSGFAGQYLLGPGLQPSVFGVFLLSGIAFAVYQRWLLAFASLWLGCMFHATYMLPAGMIAVGFLIEIARTQSIRKAFIYGFSWGLALLPMVVFTAIRFAPTSSELFAQAQYLLAHFRIPHHTHFERWNGVTFIFQFLMLLSAYLFVWKHPLGWLILICMIMGVGLTLIEIWTQNATLALLFPWRISAVLIPAASSIWIWMILKQLPVRNWLQYFWWTITGLSVIGGLWIQFDQKGYYQNEEEIPLLQFVRDHHQKGDVYLLPVHIPKPGITANDPVSTTFTPPPTRKQKTLIAVDLQRFRLYTGTPIYVDFKSVPYKDTEVLEWHRRLLNADRWFQLKDNWSRPEIQKELLAEGITHIVLPKPAIIDSAAYREVYSDDVYRVYQIVK